MMRSLLDTNILIHREAAMVVHQDVGKLFFWLDKLKYEQCIHPVSLGEIDKTSGRTDSQELPRKA